MNSNHDAPGSAIPRLHQAEAAAREALAKYWDGDEMSGIGAAVDDLLAALDAARGQAVAQVAERGFVRWLNGENLLPIGAKPYAAPPAALAVQWDIREAVELLKSGAPVVEVWEKTGIYSDGLCAIRDAIAPPAALAVLTDAERKALEGAMANAEHDAGDVEDACPRQADDEDAYWAWNKYHGLRKLLATPAQQPAALAVPRFTDIEAAARYGWEHANWEWENVRIGLGEQAQQPAAAVLLDGTGYQSSDVVRIVRERQAKGIKPAASVPAGWSLHDRVEFALRDAGFDYDEASRIAMLAAANKENSNG